jgi:CheY-like chemotaxis protein
MLEREHGRVDVRYQEEVGRVEIIAHLPTASVTSVLIVDDNLDFLRLCQRYLDGTHYRATVASRAGDALRIAQEALPDIILIDALMPSQDGWDLLAALKRDLRTQDIPVIVCSVLREPSLAIGLGAAEFLPKPVSLLSLLGALERVEARRSGDRGSP